MNLKIKAIQFTRKPTPEEIRFGYGAEAHCFFSWSQALAARKWIKYRGLRWTNKGALMVPAGTRVLPAGCAKPPARKSALDSGPKF